MQKMKNKTQLQRIGQKSNLLWKMLSWVGHHGQAGGNDKLTKNKTKF